MVFFLLFGLEVRSEHIVRVFSCGYQHLSVVRVETQLLDIFLPLMQEHKLRRNVLIIILHLLVLIDFDREVPDSELVIGGSDGEDGVFTGLELKRGDGGGVPPDARDRLVAARLVEALVVEHPQVPDPELALVVARGQQELASRVPTQHVHVAVVGAERDLSFHLGRSQVPQLHCLIHRARG